MKPHPPKRTLSFLRWFCREDYLEEIEGDLIELFDQQAGQSLRKANWLFFWRVIQYFRPAFLKAFPTHKLFISRAMIKHNFVIAFRGFLRNKTSFLINLIGLSTGLACAFLIFLWVQDELSVDTFHEKDAQLYQVMKNMPIDGEILTMEGLPVLLADALQTEIPEVASAVATNADFCSPEGIFTYEDQSLKTKVEFASENFFEVLSYPLLAGEPRDVLAGKNQVVVSKALARNLFGSVEAAMGKSLQWNYQFDGGTYEEPLLISGVFSGPPANATEQFDAVVHFDLLIKADYWAGDWSGDYAEIYVVLQEGTDIEQFNEKIVGFLNEKHESKWDKQLFVQQYSEMYLHGQYENGVQVGGRISYVRLFSIIALFILVIACINFMNLSTAKASQKMKEIGVKKTIGASRKSLAIQFLNESTLIALLSSLIALLWVSMLLPQFNFLTGKQLSLQPTLVSLMAFLIIPVFTGLLAGSYPALYLSGFKPLAVLKGKLHILPESYGFAKAWSYANLLSRSCSS